MSNTSTGNVLKSWTKEAPQEFAFKGLSVGQLATQLAREGYNDNPIEIRVVPDKPNEFILRSRREEIVSSVLGSLSADGEVKVIPVEEATDFPVLGYSYKSELRTFRDEHAKTHDNAFDKTMPARFWNSLARSATNRAHAAHRYARWGAVFLDPSTRNVQIELFKATNSQPEHGTLASPYPYLAGTPELNNDTADFLLHTGMLINTGFVANFGEGHQDFGTAYIDSLKRKKQLKN